LEVEYVDVDNLPKARVGTISSPLPIPRSPVSSLQEAVPIRNREEREGEILRGMVSQLERLQNLTKGSQYDLMVSQDGVFSYIRDGECDSYRVKSKAGRAHARSLRVVITLPALFESASTIGRDVGAICDGIQERLANHLGNCAGYLNRVKRRLAATMPDEAVKRADSDVRSRLTLIDEYRSLLDELDNTHRVLIRKAEEVQTDELSVEEDLLRARESSRILEELKQCLVMKKRAVGEVRRLRSEIDAIAFPLEQALFDTQDLLGKAERGLWQLS